MDLLALGLIVLAIAATLALPALIGFVGVRILSRATRRGGRHVSTLPAWWIGGTPEVSPPDDRDESQ